MVARVDLENEHMVHSRTTPAVRVEPDEEDVKYDEQAASIELESDLPVIRQLAVFDGQKRLWQKKEG